MIHQVSGVALSTLSNRVRVRWCAHACSGVPVTSALRHALRIPHATLQRAGNVDDNLEAKAKARVRDNHPHHLTQLISITILNGGRAAGFS